MQGLQVSQHAYDAHTDVQLENGYILLVLRPSVTASDLFLKIYG